MTKWWYMSLILLLLVGCHAQDEPVVVELRSRCFDFSSAQAPIPMVETIDGQVLEYESEVTDGFTLTMQLDLQGLKYDVPQPLLEVGDIVKLTSRLHDPNDWKPQNYPAYKAADGSVPVIEAELTLLSDDGTRERLTVGIPLALLGDPLRKRELMLHFTGVEFSIYVDGRLYDSDFAIGYPPSGKLCVVRSTPSVSNIRFYSPALRPTPVEEHKVDDNIQYWTPPYHNAWVGDVATCYYQGRYHVFYLFDRRGHASKLNRGGHYFEHLSTADFKTWVEHEPAVAIDHQWETLGTGTPFVADGKLCLAYGLHSTRIFPREMTTLPLMWDYYQQHHATMVLDYTSYPHLIPAGSSYAVSEDGVANFTKSHILIHPCENPSIFTDADGNLCMLANYGSRGEWSAQSLRHGWVCENDKFPPGGDCTFYFEWDNYDYIIGGFSQLYSRRHGEPDSRWWNVVAEGRDMYNGLSVPAISEITDGRRLIAGWVKTQNWGGILTIHELVQFPDGRLGTRWMPEIVPATHDAVSLPVGDIAAPSPSFMLTFDAKPVHAQQGRIGLTLCGADGYASSCEWNMQFDRSRAQFSTGVEGGFAPDERTLREGGDVSTAYNYAIAGGMPQEGTTQVRVMVYHADKLHGSIVDVEIAGQRTMLSYRPDLSTTTIKLLLDDVQVCNLRYAPLK